MSSTEFASVIVRAGYRLHFAFSGLKLFSSIKSIDV